VLVIRFTEGSASLRLREEGFIEKLAANGALKTSAQQFTDGSMADDAILEALGEGIQEIVMGAVIVVAVVIDNLRNRRRA